MEYPRLVTVLRQLVLEFPLEHRPCRIYIPHVRSALPDLLFNYWTKYGVDGPKR